MTFEQSTHNEVYMMAIAAATTLMRSFLVAPNKQHIMSILESVELKDESERTSMVAVTSELWDWIERTRPEARELTSKLTLLLEGSHAIN